MGSGQTWLPGGTRKPRAGMYSTYAGVRTASVVNTYWKIENTGHLLVADEPL